MPKTKNAFAMCELYVKLFTDKLNNDPNWLYNKFLLKGYVFNYDEKSTVKWAQHAFRQALYKSRRADFLSDRIDEHIEKLQKIYCKSAEYRDRINDLNRKYLQIKQIFIESALDIMQFAIGNQSQLRKIFLQEFGKRLCMARRQANITQTQLAKQLNISQNGYSQYETGIREPPLYLIGEMAQILKVSIDWLFGQE